MVRKMLLKRVVSDKGSLTTVLDKDILNCLHLGFGQVYVVTFQGVGIVRGNHYHLRQSETLVAIQGVMEVHLRCIDTDMDWRFELSSADHEAAAITFGPRIAHAVVSLTDSAALLSHSDMAYDSEDPDRVPFVVLEGKRP